eukprot:s1441_g7.t1
MTVSHRVEPVEHVLRCVCAVFSRINSASILQIKHDAEHDASGVPEFEYAPHLANDIVASVETKSFIKAPLTNLGL